MKIHSLVVTWRADNRYGDVVGEPETNARSLARAFCRCWYRSLITEEHRTLEVPLFPFLVSRSAGFSTRFLASYSPCFFSLLQLISPTTPRVQSGLAVSDFIRWPWTLVSPEYRIDASAERDRTLAWLDRAQLNWISFPVSLAIRFIEWRFFFAALARFEEFQTALSGRGLPELRRFPWNYEFCLLNP